MNEAIAEVIEARTVVVDDATLLARIRDGDHWAEEALYRRFAPALSTMLLRLVGNRADAQDALQESFIAILKDIDRVREPSSLQAWVSRVGVRQAHRVFRRRRLLRRLGFGPPLDDARLESLAATDASPDVKAELAVLGAKLAELPAKDRMAWMLRHVEGETLPRVAELCDCSLATAKRRIAAAARRLTDD